MASITFEGRKQKFVTFELLDIFRERTDLHPVSFYLGEKEYSKLDLFDYHAIIEQLITEGVE